MSSHIGNQFGFTQTIDTITDGGISLCKYKSNNTGLTVCIVETEGPIVSGYICIATEAYDDDGLPHTLEHLVFLGSEKYPYKGVLDMLANRCLASGTNAWTDTDHTCYTMTTAGSDGFLKLLPIYLDHLLYPLLTDSAFTTEVYHVNPEGEDSGVIYCEMQGRENTAESRCHLAMLRAIYPGHCGYKSETGGLLKNLRENTTNERVRAYHKEFYRPENICIMIMGKIKAQDVFETIYPIEQRLIKEGPRDPFKRPWQNPVLPLQNSATIDVEYPCEEDDSGIVITAWRGPSAKEYSHLITVEVLMQYLTESSISPFQRDLIECIDPYCNQIDYTVIENSTSCIYMHFANVPIDKLKNMKKKITTILEKIANGTEELDMTRMASVIHTKKLNILTRMESSPHDQLAMSLIGDFLYGTSLNDLKQRVQQVPIIESLLAKDAEFWKNLIRSYMLDGHCIMVLGYPSPKLSESMEKDEKKRIEERQKQLGPDGLKKCAEALAQAVKQNEIQPSPEFLTSVSIPSVKEIQFHSIKRSTNVPENSVNPAVEFAVDKMPCRFQVDDVKSNFVRIFVLLDTTKLSKSLRMLLPLYIELLTESAVSRNGEIIPYNEIVKQLDEETISVSTQIGFGYSRFSCDIHAQVVCLEFMVEEHQYSKGIKWSRELLFHIVFDEARIKVIANKMINDIPQLKRSGMFITKNIMKNLNFSSDSNKWTSCMMRQQTFLKELLQNLSTEPSKVINALNELRNEISTPDKITIHLAANLPNLKRKNIDLESPWLNKFLPPHLKPEKAKCLPKPCYELINNSNQLPKNIVIGLSSIETSFLLMSAPCFTSFTHPDYPALLVAIQYFTQTEGPLYKNIRGMGLAYGYAIFARPNDGLIHFLLYRANHVVGSYIASQKLIDSYVSNHTQWDPSMLEAACSSLVFEIIEGEKTITDVVRQSVSAYYKNVDMDHTKYLLDQIIKVTFEDLERVGNKYLKPLFDPESSKCSLCVHSSKVNAAVNGFKQFSRNLTVLPSLEDSMLTQY